MTEMTQTPTDQSHQPQIVVRFDPEEAKAVVSVLRSSLRMDRATNEMLEARNAFSAETPDRQAQLRREAADREARMQLLERCISRFDQATT